nr:DnaB-like helicase N-terminal domain-containing protein [Lyngbya sp. CCAP 1446/10]
MAVSELMPTNFEAEEAILGGILIDPIAINRVTNILRPEAFAITAHQQIYRAYEALHSLGKPTDLMSVTTFLADRNVLELVGGHTKLAMLVDHTVSAVNIDQYAFLVMDKFVRRSLIVAGNDIVQLGYETSTELDAVLNKADQKIFALNKYKEERQQAIRPLSEYCQKLWLYLDEIQEQRLKTENYSPGISTGFYDLNELLGGGFYRGELRSARRSSGQRQNSFGLRSWVSYCFSSGQGAGFDVFDGNAWSGLGSEANGT